MRILLVTSRYPWPVRRGNQMRTVQMAEWLAVEHQVTVLAPRPEPDQELPAALPFAVELYRSQRRRALLGGVSALWRGSPLQSGIYDEPALHRALAARAASVDLVILQLALSLIHI